MKALITILSVLILFCASDDAAAGDRIRLTNGEWPPYTSKALPHYGFMSRIVTEAFDQVEINAEYTFFDSWKRCYILAKKGKFDGSLTWIPTLERKKDFYFCDPVITLENVFFHLKTLNFDWNTMDDLTPFRISITSSYSYEKDFDSAVKQGKIVPYIVYRDIVNIQNLIQGRVDIFPMEKKVGYALLRKNFSPEEQARVTHHPKSLETTFPTVIISKQIDPARAQHLVTAFNKGLKRLKQSGRYREIISRYQP